MAMWISCSLDSARRNPSWSSTCWRCSARTSWATSASPGCWTCSALRYTGCGPGEAYLQQDKGLAKKLLAFDQIRYPDFAVFAADSTLETGGNLQLPLFVKPLRADASIGIDERLAGPHVHRADEARASTSTRSCTTRRWPRSTSKGASFTSACWATSDPHRACRRSRWTSPGSPTASRGSPTRKAKWDERTAPSTRGRARSWPTSPTSCRPSCKQAAIDAYRALRVRDYGRVDFRVTDTGDIYVIEVNASCYLEQRERVRHRRQSRGHRIQRPHRPHRAARAGAARKAALACGAEVGVRNRSSEFGVCRCERPVTRKRPAVSGVGDSGSNRPDDRSPFPRLA